MKFYEIGLPETKCRMHILMYSVGMKATRRKAAVHYIIRCTRLISRKSEKSYA